MFYKEKEFREVYLIESPNKEDFLRKLRDCLSKIKYRGNSHKIHFSIEEKFDSTYVALVEELKTKSEPDYL